MEIVVEPTYEALGSRVAADLLQTVSSVQNPLLCLTSGSTPAAVYRALVQLIRTHKIDYSSWSFVGLDEWAGMNEEDAGSCHHFVKVEVFDPLRIARERICFFDGRASDLEKECTRTEAFINAQGGIAAAIVGLGLNGHVGMNEPGTPPSQRAHVAALAGETQRTGQKYFNENKDLSKGLTLGLANLLQATHLFLVANGTAKAEVVKRIVEERETERLPATLLKNHPHLKIHLDAAAASMLQ